MQATPSSLSAAVASGKLSARDVSGANTLIGRFNQYGNWTGPQQQWADDILRRAGEAIPALPTSKVGPGFGKVVAMLNVAGSRLVRPTITLLDDADQLVAIVLIKERDRVVVRRPDKAGSRYGRTLASVTKEGDYFETNEMTVASADLLEKLGEDTAGTALQNARKTGLCCFCNRKLTDPRSTLHGYGETCAGNYGLPWRS